MADMKTSPFCYFDAIYYINLDRDGVRLAEIEGRLERLGIRQESRRFSAIPSPDNGNIGCTLSHRSLVAKAKALGHKNILVFEDDALFHRDIHELLPLIVKNLDRIDWDLFYLGGHTWGSVQKVIPGCPFLRRPENITTTHAIAYNHSSYDRILEGIPEEGMLSGWIGKWRAIDQYLDKSDLRKLVASPMISMQPNLFDQPHAPRPELFF